MLNRRFLSLLLLPVIAGCTSLFPGMQERVRSGTSSSLVDYLYPDGEMPPAQPTALPRLELPLRVGIAFVPSRHSSDIAAADRQRMLSRVSEAFADRRYVASIETIPDQYMRGARGVVGMQQVAALYNLDVMALVSYDQVSFSGERESSLLYWTIVGTLVVKGNSNEVRTMIDTAVFDVPSGRLLFRAPGVYDDARNATLADVDRDLRKLRREGFVNANENMIVALAHELDDFEQRVRNGERAEIVSRNGGGGATGGLVAIIMAILAMLVSLARLRRAIACERGFSPSLCYAGVT